MSALPRLAVLPRSLTMVFGLLAACFIAVWLLPAPVVVAPRHYLPLHTAMEVFAVAVAGLVFALGWNGHHRGDPGQSAFIGSAFLAVGLLDLGHLMSYAGMPDFVTPAGPEKAIAFWLAGRLLDALALFACALFIGRSVPVLASRGLPLGVMLGFAGGVYGLVLFYPGLLPRTFIPGEGLTPFKVAVEYGIVGLHVATAAILLRKLPYRSQYDVPGLLAATLALMFSELCFTLYATVSDLYNLLGHACKVVAYALVYRVVFVDGVRRPYLAQRQAEARERRAIAAALAESEARFRAMAETVPEIVFSGTLGAGIEYLNGRFEEVTGMAAQAGQGTGWMEVVHPGDRVRIAKRADAAITGGAEWQSTFRLRTAQGTYRWYAGRARPLRDARTRVTRMFGCASDVHDLKRTEARLRQSEAGFRAMFEHASVGIALLDEHGRILRANDTLARILGYGRHELLAQPLADLARGEDVVSPLEEFHRVQRGELDHFDQELRLTRKGGDTVWVNISLSAARATNLELHYSVLVVQDVSERRRAEAELREADRHKDHFLAMLGHELRNPLAPMSNALQIMRLSRSDGPGRDRAMAILERQLDHLVHLVDDLLDISRISRGKLTLRREMVDVAKAIHVAVEASRPLIEQGRHELRVSLPDEALVVDGDSVRLAQIFSNLLNNSARYTPPGGHIEIAVERQAQEACIAVRDDGIGIAPDSMPRLFRLFGQLNEGQGPQQGGLGIGLALVRSLARLHGGSVTAQSEGLGRGAEFVVRLPLSLQEEIPLRTALPAAAAEGHLRVLVADDNADGADTLAVLLRLRGHEVGLARDGVEALAYAQQFRPELIFLDLGMPRMGGLEAAARIRDIAADYRPLICALTGWGQESDRLKSREAGCDAHYVKPIHQEELHLCLQRAVRLRQAAQTRATGAVRP